MKVTLKELCWLLRDERRGLTELQQQFAKAKATWETERAELKSHTTQVSLPPDRDLSPLVLSAQPSAVGSGSRMSKLKCLSVPGDILPTRTPGPQLPAVLVLSFLSSQGSPSPLLPGSVLSPPLKLRGSSPHNPA